MKSGPLVAQIQMVLKNMGLVLVVNLIMGQAY